MQGGGAQNRSVVDLREDFGGTLGGPAGRVFARPLGGLSGGTTDAADGPAVGFGTGS